MTPRDPRRQPPSCVPSLAQGAPSQGAGQTTRQTRAPAAEVLGNGVALGTGDLSGGTGQEADHSRQSEDAPCDSGAVVLDSALDRELFGSPGSDDEYQSKRTKRKGSFGGEQLESAALLSQLKLQPFEKQEKRTEKAFKSQFLETPDAVRQQKDADVAEKALKALQALQAFVKNRVSSMAPEQDTSLQQALALLSAAAGQGQDSKTDGADGMDHARGGEKGKPDSNVQDNFAAHDLSVQGQIAVPPDSQTFFRNHSLSHPASMAKRKKTEQEATSHGPDYSVPWMPGSALEQEMAKQYIPCKDFDCRQRDISGDECMYSHKRGLLRYDEPCHHALIKKCTKKGCWYDHKSWCSLNSFELGVLKSWARNCVGQKAFGYSNAGSPHC